MNKNIVKFLSKITKELENLSNADIKKLESGEYSLSLKLLKTKTSKKAPDSTIDKKIVEDAIKELDSCNSRELGLKVINKYFKKRKELEFFAKETDIYITKQDKVAEVKEKIVEGIVGARLRSNAILKRDN